MIVLTHPVHGIKHAYLEAEAEADEKNGWIRQAEPMQMSPSGTVDDPVIDEAELRTELTLEQRYTEKFGKPPHHRMKPETIEAALRG